MTPTCEHVDCVPYEQYRALRAERDAAVQEREALLSAVSCAWPIIASAHGGDWTKAAAFWQHAAEAWRDEHLHPALDRMSARAAVATAQGERDA